MYAATNGHLACLTYLADKGANIETKNYVSTVSRIVILLLQMIKVHVHMPSAKMLSEYS